MKAKEMEIPEGLVDEIVEEILEETKPNMLSAPKPSKKLKETDLLEDSVDAVKLKSRLQYLENRVEKHTHDYKISAIEVERQIASKFSEFEQDTEKQLIYLQSQLEYLRTAMIKISNEFKQFKESISSQKQ